MFVFDWSVDWGYIWLFFKGLIINGFIYLGMLSLASIGFSLVIAAIVNVCKKIGDGEL